MEIIFSLDEIKQVAKKIILEKRQLLKVCVLIF